MIYDFVSSQYDETGRNCQKISLYEFQVFLEKEHEKTKKEYTKTDKRKRRRSKFFDLEWL